MGNILEDSIQAVGTLIVGVILLVCIVGHWLFTEGLPILIIGGVILVGWLLWMFVLDELIHPEKGEVWRQIKRKHQLIDVSKKLYTIHQKGKPSPHSIELCQRIRELWNGLNEEERKAFYLYQAKSLTDFVDNITSAKS